MKKFRKKTPEVEAQKSDPLLPEEENKNVGKDGKKLAVRLMILIVVTMAVFAVYRFSMNYPYFQTIMFVYMALATAVILPVLGVMVILGYVIYNRGFSRRGVTAQMLPDSWSDEEKERFIADGKRRLDASRWMLYPIFAFLFTFAMEIVELIVIPFFKGLIR